MDVQSFGRAAIRIAKQSIGGGAVAVVGFKLRPRPWLWWWIYAQRFQAERYHVVFGGKPGAMRTPGGKP